MRLAGGALSAAAHNDRITAITPVIQWKTIQRRKCRRRRNLAKYEDHSEAFSLVFAKVAQTHGMRGCLTKSIPQAQRTGLLIAISARAHHGIIGFMRPWRPPLRPFICLRQSWGCRWRLSPSKYHSFGRRPVLHWPPSCSWVIAFGQASRWAHWSQTQRRRKKPWRPPAELP